MKYSGLIYILALSCLAARARADCWDTGCQPNSWATTGCAQYGRTETGRRDCSSSSGPGRIYSCCSGDSGPGPKPPGPARETGICSWYGADGEIPQGWPTASGEGFDRNALTAAHKTLPFGTNIRVRNPANGKTVVVRINDRGPFSAGRIVDLTYAAFGIIEDRGKGLINDCSYEIV